jgi:glycosyltransferase involved in cell wall biosynthesis
LPISLIVTCFNEEGNVRAWCSSLLAMDALPAEIVVSDSDSTDRTVALLREALEQQGPVLVIIPGRCSIAEGRNRAIEQARHERIAITDFGVTFERPWLSALHEALDDCDWVGGCYRLTSRNRVQSSFTRLFDVLPDQLDESSFLPSSRSFALRRSCFAAAGGYDTSLILGEDTAYVLRLRSLPLRYRLERRAIVHWLPRDSLHAIYLQNYRYAYWDGRAGQSAGRWTHVAFWAAVTSPALFAAMVAKSGTSWAALALAATAIGILAAKVARNTLRSSAQTLPRPIDLLVYYVTTTGSVIGYLAGVWQRRRANQR